jgi:riboflavin kinase/FMN adenylyltransferase
MSDLEAQLEQLQLPGGTVAAVGTFDGVHLGHRALLGAVRDAAAASGQPSLALTFRVQPRAVVQPDLPVSYLSTLERRLNILRTLGLDAVLAIDFDEPLRKISAGEFLALLKRAVGLRELVLGSGARMGHDRVDAEGLKRVAAGLGIGVIEVPPATAAGRKVSSSAIREALQGGDLAAANEMLGRKYVLDGMVVPGDRRGRELGFPTANIDPAPQLVIPGNGIYATVIEVDDRIMMAATSIGVRPTFGGGRRLVEAYVLDFDGDLYGHEVALKFVKRLRGEIKFDGAGPLIEQMKRDVEETRSVLSTLSF